MKQTLTWITRGGITAALVVLIASVWPFAAVEQSQTFAFPDANLTQATIQFRAPENLYRGQWANFIVFLDLDRELVVDEDIHLVMVYRLELDGAEIVPAAIYQIPLTGVQHQEAEWRVRLPRDGDYDGTWWVYVEYVGQEGEILDRQALFARRFAVESRGILGLSLASARWVSMIVMMLGFGVEVWRRLRRK